jgi:phage regulator Rha-like protein
MEFPHELKELYPDKIIEVRGNADALTVILNSEVDIHKFKAELIKKFSGLEEKQTLFIKHEDKQDFEKLVLE